MANNLDLAWAAGFIDGEGSIGVYERRAGYKGLMLGAAQVRREPLDRLVGLFGGKIRVQRSTHPKRRDAWAWRIYAGNAAIALREMLPFMSVKGGEARLGIAFQLLMHPNRVGRPYRLNGWDHAERQAFAEALKEAKRGQ